MYGFHYLRTTICEFQHNEVLDFNLSCLSSRLSQFEQPTMPFSLSAKLHRHSDQQSWGAKQIQMQATDIERYDKELFDLHHDIMILEHDMHTSRAAGHIASRQANDAWKKLSKDIETAVKCIHQWAEWNAKYASSLPTDEQAALQPLRRSIAGMKWMYGEHFLRFVGRDSFDVGR